jgi:hypothetical protein
MMDTTPTRFTWRWRVKAVGRIRARFQNSAGQIVSPTCDHNGNVFFHRFSPSQSTLTNRQSFVQHCFLGGPFTPIKEMKFEFTMNGVVRRVPS